MQPDGNTMVSVLAVLSPILLAILGGIGWLYRHEKQRREAVEHQLSEYKYKAYITLLDIFFDVIKATKAGKTINPKSLINRVIDANKDLIIYGSDDVVRPYVEWQGSAKKGRIDIKQWGEIIISIRRDMGNRKTRITSEEVLRLLVTDYDDAKAKGLL